MIAEIGQSALALALLLALALAVALLAGTAAPRLAQLARGRGAALLQLALVAIAFTILVARPIQLVVLVLIVGVAIAGLAFVLIGRLLAKANPPGAAPKELLTDRNLLWATLGVVVVVIAAATGFYTLVGRPHPGDAGAQSATQAAALPANHPVADVGAMVGKLEAKLKQSPNDPEGWRMLGWSYVQMGRNADAATAYGRAAALDPANAEYLSAQGESLAMAAGGKVTPASRAAFQAALSRDTKDPRARYFLAVYKDQNGDRKGAMADWIALLKSAPPGAAWAAEVRGFVEKTARERGEDIAGLLPPASLPPAPLAAATGAPGPSADQVAAAGQMAPQDRQAMITGMVQGLAARLKANPRDAAGWVQLMRARMVLGDAPAAGAAYSDAMKAFAGDPSQQADLRKAARDLSVPGA